MPSVPGAEHLAFRCTACGDCCRRMRVALTHRDLARLVKARGVTPASLVAWLAPATIDLDAESASLVTLPSGPRLMVLAHEAQGCVFLGSDDRCAVYESRPKDCRVYPFVLERDEARKVTRLAVFDPSGCGDRDGGSHSLEEVGREDAERWREVEAYRGHVARWNRLASRRRRFGHRAAGESEFLAFLRSVPDLL